MIDSSSFVCACGDVLSTDLDRGLIMMDMEHGRYLNLNPVGAAIWREIAKPTKVADLCRTLEQRYDATSGAIERDVLNLLRQLAALELVRVHSCAMKP